MRIIMTLPGILIGLAAFMAVPAAAQYGSAPPPPPPTEPPRGAPAAPAAPAAATAPGELLRGAACAIGRDANSGTALLATVPRSPEERSQAGVIVRAAQRCLRMREPIATSAMTIRWAIAEALYEARFATPAAARMPALGVAPMPRPAANEEQIVAQLAPMYALTDCSLPRQPDLVRAVLATEPRSPEERAALAALHPTFAACVPPGTQLTYDPRVMRAFFAEALYRWSVVQRDGAASPWAAAPAAAPAAPVR